MIRPIENLAKVFLPGWLRAWFIHIQCQALAERAILCDFIGLYLCWKSSRMAIDEWCSVASDHIYLRGWVDSIIYVPRLFYYRLVNFFDWIPWRDLDVEVADRLRSVALIWLFRCVKVLLAVSHLAKNGFFYAILYCRCHHVLQIALVLQVLLHWLQLCQERWLRLLCLRQKLLCLLEGGVDYARAMRLIVSVDHAFMGLTLIANYVTARAWSFPFATLTASFINGIYE